jgi:S-adenosylmethionine-dependent methyltransferase
MDGPSSMPGDHNAELQRVRRRLAGTSTHEWKRLQSTPVARVEYLITSYCLARYLPSDGLILDAGCGPGRYAVDLVDQGYEVVLFDLMHIYLAFARAKIADAGDTPGAGEFASCTQGDLAALLYPDRVFDVVLCLGAPLSYMLERPARHRAVQELARIAKPGGLVFLTGIGRLACYRGGIYWGLWDMWDLFTTPEAQATGLAAGYDAWYTFAPGELGTLAEDAGLDVVDQVGCEGLAAYLPMKNLEAMEAHPTRWPVWRDILLKTCNEPSIVGVSNHLLVIARKERTKRSIART